jgi:hypothetical protein
MRIGGNVELHLDETLFSFLSRIACANGIGSMRQFLDHMDLQLRDIVDGSRSAIRRIEELTGVNETALLNALPLVEPEMIQLNGQSITRRLWPQAMKFCPCCVIQDIATGSGTRLSRPFVRASWICETTSICPEHGLRLALSDQYRDGHTKRDFSLFVSGNMSRIGSLADSLPRIAPVAADWYFYRRLNFGSKGSLILDTLPFYMAAKLCEILGKIITHGINTRPQTMSPIQLDAVREAGFELLSKGETALEEFLVALTEKYWTTANRKPPSAYFGQLYTWLEKLESRDEVRHLSELLRKVAAESFPLGPGDAFLGEVTDRRIHTVRTAMRKYDLSTKEVCELFAEAALSESDAPRYQGAAVFDANATDVIFETKNDRQGRKVISRALGLERMRATIFSPSWQHALRPIPDSTNRQARFSMAEGKALLSRLTANAGDHRGAEMIQIDAVGRWTGLTYKQVLQYLYDGELSRVSFDATLGLAGIKVSYKELREKNTAPHRGELIVEEVAAELRSSVEAVNFLIEKRYFKATRIEHDDDRYWVVAPSSLLSFKAKYTSTETLANLENCLSLHVEHIFRQRGVEPVIRDRHRRPLFYENSELATPT